VAECLSFHGYECFLPLRYKNEYRITPISKDDRLPTVPLFPGYLFCRYKTQHNFRIVDAANVIRIISYDNIPTVIPDDVIKSLQKVAGERLLVEPCQFIQSDTKVRVESGPLKGTEGYLVQENKNSYKISLGVSAIGQSVMVDVFNSDIRVIHENVRVVRKVR